jgi:hypothetical protein
MPMARTQDFLCCKTSLGILYQYAVFFKKATACTGLKAIIQINRWLIDDSVNLSVAFYK